MRVLITTGGSGGHIFPALQVALQLKARGHEVIFAGALRMAQEKVAACGFNLIQIPAQGLISRTPIGIVRFVWAMLTAIVMACKTLRGVHPDKVIGFGGYGSFAIIVAAWIFRVPSMIHEQNVVPGKANRLMSVLVRKIAISFKTSVGRFPQGKTIWTGCPCHSGTVHTTRGELLTKFGLTSDAKVVLLLGGSQGSHRLNEVFFNLMKNAGQELQIQGLHMTGQGEYAAYQSKYKENKLPVGAYPFITNIEEAYRVADVVIARAGASTVCELGLLGKAAVVVPYPFAGNHQLFNAQVLTDAGAAILIEEKNLSEGSLKQALQSLLNSSKREESASIIPSFFKKDAAYQLALAIEEV